MPIATCIECGCDDLHACEGGCSWERVDYDAGLGVCSECGHRVEDWDCGDRTLGEEARMVMEMPSPSADTEQARGEPYVRKRSMSWTSPMAWRTPVALAAIRAPFIRWPSIIRGAFHGPCGPHVALSVLKNEVEEPKKTLVRSIGRMIANVFHGDWRDEGDPENTLVEDLPIKNGVLRDVVVSWARDAGKLKKEVDTIRACLDHAGVLDNTIFKDFTVDGDVSTPIAGVKVQYDNQNCQAKVDGNLHLGKIMAAAQMLHIPIPASCKADLDLHFQTHIPYDDPRSKFIAAMLAVQLQSKAVDLTCQRIESHRKNIASAPDDALLLHGTMEEFVHPAKGYLLNAIAATRKELDRACSVHPSGKLTLVEVDAAVRSVMERNYEGAFTLVESVENASLPVRDAMGDNFYLFAAQIYLLSQVNELENDLKSRLKASPRPPSNANAADTGTPPSSTSPSPAAKPKRRRPS